ncbi:hypothetical protein [Streptomyces sp. NPDC008141]|uniref:hypothetical protein n=1 Tax=Streptomyces sp. NPDC008141 TaxID=3364815 RepID=UPI0036E39FE3
MTASTDQTATGGVVDHPARPATAGDDQGALHLEAARIQARRQLVMDSIRADLSEQPSDVSVRGAARRWAQDIYAAADEISSRMRKT